MPIVRFSSGTPEERKEREELIEKALPKNPIVNQELSKQLIDQLQNTALEMLKKEIEVYKAIPKRTEMYNDEIFNPRNTINCFMGHGFQYNNRGVDGWTDETLFRYRKAVGTIEHPTWGDCTILEIWGGDHFEKYPEMVKGVYNYCWGKSDTLPELHFYINPFIKNEESGTWETHPEENDVHNNQKFIIKVAHYLEIQKRMEKEGVDSPLDLPMLDNEEI